MKGNKVLKRGRDLLSAPCQPRHLTKCPARMLLSPIPYTLGQASLFVRYRVPVAVARWLITHRAARLKPQATIASQQGNHDQRRQPS